MDNSTRIVQTDHGIVKWRESRHNRRAATAVRAPGWPRSLTPAGTKRGGPGILAESVPNRTLRTLRGVVTDALAPPLPDNRDMLRLSAFLDGLRRAVRAG